MAKDNTKDLTIRIAGQVDKSLTNSLNTASGQVSNFSKTLSKVGKAGLAAMGALATGTVATIVKCTNVAEEFESNMADVVKYVNGLADETGQISDKLADNGQSYAENYSQMKKAILDLSTQIPYTAEDLTKLAASAGQAGYSMEELVQFDENGEVQGFLKDVAMWGTAMDISADQAGQWAAKWENAFNMSHEDVMDLADVINYLGANSATTAAEIAEVVNSTVSMGQMAGVDEKTTVAIADAMLAMGVNSNRAGTAIKRMYTNLTKGYASTSTIRNALAKIGMDAEEVAQSMQVNGTQTILDILAAIKELPGDEQLATVSSLFGQWAVEGGGKLANNIELLEWAINAANDPSLYQGSMEREFIIRASTAESIDTMLSNAKYALEEEFGEAFLPVKKQFSLLMIDVINGLKENMPQLEQIAENMATILGGAVSALGSAFEKALPYIQSALDYIANNGEQVAKIIGGLAATFATMSFAPTIEKVARGAGGLLFGQNSITSAITGTTVGNQRKGGIVNGITGLFGKAKTGVKNAGTAVGNYVGGVGQAAGGVGSAVSGLGTSLSMAAGNAKSILGAGTALSTVTGAADTAGLMSYAVASPIQAIGSVGSSLLNLGTTALAPLTSMFTGVMSAALPIVGVVGTIIAVLSILYDNLDGLRDIVGNVFGEKGLEVFDTFKGGLYSIISTIDNILNGGLADALSGVRDMIEGVFGEDAATTFDSVVTIVQSILGVVGQLVNFANTSLKPIIEKIFSFITTTVMPIIVDTFNNAAPIIGDIITNVGTAVMNVAGIIADAIDTAMPIIESIIEVIMNVGSVVIPALLEGFNGLWEGINQVIEDVKGIFDGLIEFIDGVFSGNWAQAWEGIKETFSSAFQALVDLCKTPINAVIAVINNVIEQINGIGFTVPDWVPFGLGGKSFSINIPTLNLLAKGGFTNGPSIAGESGTEAVISFARAVREQNIATWATAGQMLGVLDNGRSLEQIDGSAGSTQNVTFSPQITINGNADDATVDYMLEQMQEMFDSWYEKRIRQQSRTAY